MVYRKYKKSTRGYTEEYPNIFISNNTSLLDKISVEKKLSKENQSNFSFYLLTQWSIYRPKKQNHTFDYVTKQEH